MKEEFDSFRSKLDKQYSWPALYTFKFICPKEKIEEVKALFIKHDISEKPSNKGNYMSLTINVMASSSEIIINSYIEVNKIKGIIAL